MTNHPNRVVDAELVSVAVQAMKRTEFSMREMAVKLRKAFELSPARIAGVLVRDADATWGQAADALYVGLEDVDMAAIVRALYLNELRDADVAVALHAEAGMCCDSHEIAKVLKECRWGAQRVARALSQGPNLPPDEILKAVALAWLATGKPEDEKALADCMLFENSGAFRGLRGWGDYARILAEVGVSKVKSERLKKLSYVLTPEEARRLHPIEFD